MPNFGQQYQFSTPQTQRLQEQQFGPTSSLEEALMAQLLGNTQAGETLANPLLGSNDLDVYDARQRAAPGVVPRTVLEGHFFDQLLAQKKKNQPVANNSQQASPQAGSTINPFANPDLNAALRGE